MKRPASSIYLLSLAATSRDVTMKPPLAVLEMACADVLAYVEELERECQRQGLAELVVMSQELNMGYDKENLK